MKKKIIILVLSVIIVLLVLSTTTYALFFKQNKLENEESYTSGILDIVVDNTESGLGETLTLASSMPLSDADGKATTAYKFKITNQGNLTYTFDLKLLSTTVENAVSSSYIKVMIDDDDPVLLSNLTNGVVKSNLTLYPGNSVTISVRVWLDESTPNSEIGKSFSAKIVSDGVASEPPVIASEKIIKLSQGNTWKSGANGLYEVTYTKEDSTTMGKDYRYIGGNVNNYIRFNNDLYRIIGVFDENTHGKTGEYLVKIISKDLLSANSWGVVNTDASTGTYSNYYNDWTGKQYTTPANTNILFNQYFLNKTNTSGTYGSCNNWTYFYSGNNYKTYNCDLIAGYGIDDTYRDYIETTTWHLNGYNGNGLTSNNFYLCERGLYTNCTSANSGAGDSSTTAKIGLMYVSDYMYASGYKASSSTLTGSSSYNGSQNWMFKGAEWTITPYYSSADYVFRVFINGTVDSDSSLYGSGVRPTFYLKSNVKITGGEGTFDNPYTISM